MLPYDPPPEAAGDSQSGENCEGCHNAKQLDFSRIPGSEAVALGWFSYRAFSHEILFLSREMQMHPGSFSVTPTHKSQGVFWWMCRIYLPGAERPPPLFRLPPPGEGAIKMGSSFPESTQQPGTIIEPCATPGRAGHTGSA